MRRRLTGLIVTGVLVGPFLAVLDQTMVSVALPRIVAEIGGEAWYAWIKVSYLFFSTIATVVVGRLVEILPRKPVVVGAFGLYVIGSVWCGLTLPGGGGEVQGLSGAFLVADGRTGRTGHRRGRAVCSGVCDAGLAFPAKRKEPLGRAGRGCFRAGGSLEARRWAAS